MEASSLYDLGFGQIVFVGNATIVASRASAAVEDAKLHSL
jgi:hypothetical protein